MSRRVAMTPAKPPSGAVILRLKISAGLPVDCAIVGSLM
jgi:hypothetical protein